MAVYIENSWRSTSGCDRVLFWYWWPNDTRFSSLVNLGKNTIVIILLYKFPEVPLSNKPTSFLSNETTEVNIFRYTTHAKVCSYNITCFITGIYLTPMKYQLSFHMKTWYLYKWKWYVIFTSENNTVAMVT